MKLSSILKSARYATFASVFAYAAPLAFDQVAKDAGFTLSLGTQVQAQSDAERAKTRRLPGLSQNVMKKLGVVTELVSPDVEKNPNAKPNFREALKELEKMERSCKDSCNKYELSQIYRFYAFAHYSMDDYPKAIQAYKRVIAQSPEIPIAVELEALNSLSQLSYSQENYDDALRYLNQWMNLSTIVGADKIMLRGQINYAKNDKKAALRDVDQAIKMTEDNGKVAKEQWYGFQNSLYLDKEDYAKSRQILEKLIRNYPKVKYWTQYANVNGLLNRDKDQLHSLDAVYVMNGLKKRQDIVNAAYLYLGEDVPYKAAQLLEKGMKDKIVERNVKYLKTLAAAWRAAREPEKAIAVLNEAARAAKSEDAARRNEKGYRAEEGNIYAELVGLYSIMDQPKDAVEAGKKALSAGNLRRGCEVHTNMGIAYTDMEQFKSAINAFEKAQEDKQCRAVVSNWIRFAQNEQNAKEQLEKSI